MSARALVEALGGRWCGSYGMARCPAHDDRTPSLSIRDGETAPLLKCFAGCSQEAVVDALKARGLLAGSRDDRRPPGPAARPAPALAQASTDQARRTDAALAIWRSAAPAAGTLVETYLKRRGIVIPAPPTLRYHPGLEHRPTGLRLPAMVAIVQGPDGAPAAIHRTYLRVDGVSKANVINPRMALGCCRGGAVRTARAGPVLAIAEGIESALAFMQASKIPTWATLGTSGMRGIQIPPEITLIIIAADADEAGEEAARAAAERFRSEGRKVQITRPSAGGDFADLVAGAES